MVGGWFILTVAAANTLPLANSLCASGFEAWTPRFTETRRRPRSRAKAFRTVPLTPGYIFARSHHLAELTALDPQHRGFSILRSNDAIRFIHDRDLEPLRTAETRVIPKRQQRAWTKGEEVRIPEGIFAGMTGRVESSSRGCTIVSFGNVPVSFASCQLRANSALAA